MRYSSSDESNSNRKKEEVDYNKRHEQRQEKTGILCKPGLSVFYPELGDYHYAMK